MKIENGVLDNTGRFFIKENNNTLAELYYVGTSTDSINITHAEVNESLEGNGVGKQLVAAAVDYARKNSFTIKATRPYAKRILERNPEYQNIYRP